MTEKIHKWKENCILQHTHLYVLRETCMFREKEELHEKINVTGGNESESWGTVLLEWWEGHEGERSSTHEAAWMIPSITPSPPLSFFFFFYSPMPSLIDCEEGEPIAVTLQFEKTVLIKMLVPVWVHSKIVSRGKMSSQVQWLDGLVCQETIEGRPSVFSHFLWCYILRSISVRSSFTLEINTA